MAAVVLLVGGTGYLVWRPAPGPGGTTDSAALAPSDAPRAPATATPPESRIDVVGASPDAGTELRDQVVADRPTAEAALGSWFPQISTKADGLEVDGVVYDDARILAEFREAQQEYGAVLVRSDDYSTFRRPGFWVTLVPPAVGSPDAAVTWCREQGFGWDDCVAKRLSHTDGPDGNTVYQETR